MANTNLTAAKKAKNDEFYTQLSDIEKEIRHYEAHFKGKKVFLNCDDPKWSNFYVYFAQNFERLGLKKLTSTHYVEGGQSYKLEITGDDNSDGRINALDTIETPLQGNGDFRSEESIAIQRDSDIVVTNPPFSLFREYMDQLISNGKQFLIVGSMNAITYKDTFGYIRDNKLWLGVNNVKQFTTPDGDVKKFGNINWYTNIDHYKRNEEVVLYKSYNSTDYPTYDNYDAINVDKFVDTPADYNGIMGVPISFLTKYNPNQFEIIGLTVKGTTGIAGIESKTGQNGPYINGKAKYGRILIKRK